MMEVSECDVELKQEGKQEGKQGEAELSDTGREPGVVGNGDGHEEEMKIEEGEGEDKGREEEGERGEEEGEGVQEEEEEDGVEVKEEEEDDGVEVKEAEDGVEAKEEEPEGDKEPTASDVENLLQGADDDGGIPVIED